jgi:hypothetical protein
MAISSSFKEIGDAGSVSVPITPVLEAEIFATNHHLVAVGSLFQIANTDHQVKFLPVLPRMTNAVKWLAHGQEPVYNGS